jgi:MOSC domain-containing protein YiiM
MEKARTGLKAALTPDWRGGVCCNVVSGGNVRVGDPVFIA